jgi:CheY-like chemotaxis protein
VSLQTEPDLRIVLFGIPLQTAESLEHILSGWGAILYIPPQFPIFRGLGLIRDAAPDMIFAWAGGDSSTSLIEVVRAAEPNIPIVAVNAHMKSSEILDALDDGAVDYCTPPFDRSHLQGLLQAADKTACC